MGLEASFAEESNFAPWMFDVIFHDIRNYNNVALNYLYFLKEINITDDTEIINTVIQQITKSSDLLSTIEKISHNGSPPREKRIDLGVVIQHCISQIREMFPTTPIEIISLIEAGKHFIESDTLIVDLFINLLSNAIKYTPQLLKKVHLYVEEWSGSNYIAVLVADEGRGIPDTQKHKIFDRYNSRIPGEKVEGRGLGLSIVRACAERLGGSVFVKDRPDSVQGSVFEVILPLSKS
ncbi:MAG: sensor histidine kinase [Candidatus Hodarchaeota archaeon]